MNRQRAGLLIFFLSPLLMPYLIYPRIIPFYTIPAFLLCLCAVLYSETRMVERPTPLPVIPFALFLVLIGTIFVGFISHPFNSLGGNVEVPLLILISFIAFFCASANTIKVGTFYHLYLIASIVWILISVPVWLGWTLGMPLFFDLWALTNDPTPKMNGPFTNGNVLSILICVGWVFSTYYWMKYKFSYSWWILLTFLWIWIVSSMSRGAWVAQTVVLVWVIIYLLTNKSYRQLLYLLIAGLIAWVSGSALVSFQQNQADQTVPLAMQRQFTIPQQPARIVLWSTAFAIWKEHPWTGVGAGRIDAHFLDGQAKALSHMDPSKHGLTSAFDSAHNLLLHLMAEHGVAGILTWFAISTFLASSIWRYRKRLLSIRWPALASACVLWIQGMTNISMTDPFPVLLFALLLGLSYAPRLRKGFSKELYSLRPPNKYMAVFSGCLAALLFFGAYKTTSVWLDFEKWIYMKPSPEKGRASIQFVNRDDILPYLVQTSVNEFKSTGNLAAIGNMKPLILKALSAQQHPILLRQLFYSYAVRGEFEQACETGHFIEMQHWKDEANSDLYRAACKNRLTPSLNIQD